MRRFLALSDHPTLNTGFSTMTMNICNRLADMDYECFYLGQALPHAQQLVMLEPEKLIKNWKFDSEEKRKEVIDYVKKFNPRVPSVYLQDGTSFKFNLIGQGSEPYCKDIIGPWIKKVRPDIQFTLLDTFMVYPWFLDIDFSPAKTVFYYPSDGEPFLPGGVCDVILKKVNKAVAMSKFSQKQAKEFHGLDTEYIPHACDEKFFTPMSKDERQALRSLWGISDRFVVGCVARNQPRKMLDRTLKAFAKFAEDKEDAVLLLHSDPFDKATSFDISLLIKILKIQNKVLFTGVQYFSGFTYEQMREVYNLFDVFLLLTSGEGFGIPFIEALSCEVPVIATDYTTSSEIIEEGGKSGELVSLQGFEREKDKNIYSTLTGSWNVERGVASVSDACEKLNKLYYSRDLIETYGKTGRRKVLKNYTWDVVMPQWNNLFDSMIGN